MASGDQINIGALTEAALDWLDGTIALVKFKDVDVSALGDNEIVPPVAGKKIRVLGYAFTNVLALLLTFKDTPGTTRAKFDLAASSRSEFSGGVFCPAFETAVGAGVTANLSVSTGVRGHLTYMEV